MCNQNIYEMSIRTDSWEFPEKEERKQKLFRTQSWQREQHSPETQTESNTNKQGLLSNVSKSESGNSRDLNQSQVTSPESLMSPSDFLDYSEKRSQRSDLSTAHFSSYRWSAHKKEGCILILGKKNGTSPVFIFVFFLLLQQNYILANRRGNQMNGRWGKSTTHRWPC